MSFTTRSEAQSHAGGSRTVKAVALLAAVAAAALLGAALTIGASRVLPHAPDPNASEVVAARTAAHASSSGSTKRLTATATSSLSRPTVVASGGKDYCDGPKIKGPDQYDLQCAQDRVVVVAFDSAEFRHQALSVHRGLIADGWVAKDGGLPRVMAEYWDNRATYGPAYGVADLPEARYIDPRGKAEVTVEWLDPRLKDLEISVGTFYGDVAISETDVDQDAVRNAVIGQRYAVVFHRSEIYWQK